MKTNCSQLTAKPAQGSAPAAMRIGDGRLAKVEPLKAQGHTFQLTAEEAKAAPDVVAGMFLFLLFHLLFMCYAYWLYLCLGTFLVNSLPVLVLFDSEVNRSFVSHTFYCGFSVSIDNLECPLRVSIANEHGFMLLRSIGGAILRFSGCPSR